VIALDLKKDWFAGVGGLFGRTTPLYLQMEAAECGLACLAMVCAHYGNDVGLDALRKRFDVPRAGMTLQQLRLLAEGMAMTATSIEASVGELKSVGLPFIAHFKQGHYVVVTAVKSSVVSVLDPAEGEKHLSLSQFSELYAGVGLQLSPSPVFRRMAPAPKLELLTFLKSLPDLQGALIKLFIFSVSLECVALLSPYYMQITVDHVMVTADLDLLSILALAFLLLLACQGAFTAMRGWAVSQLTQSVGYQVFSHVNRHLFRLPIEYFLKRQIGDITSRFDSLSQVTQSLTRSSIEILLDGVVCMGSLTMMFVYSTQLGLIATGAALLTIVCKAVVFASSIRIVGEKVHLEARRTSHLIESMRVLHAVKMARVEDIRCSTWSRATHKIFGKALQLDRINLASSTVMVVGSGLSHCAVVWLGANLILSGQMSLGMLFAFLAFQANFTNRAAGFFDKSLSLRSLKSHFGRVGDILFTEMEPYAPPGAVQLPDAPVALIANNLAVRYSANEPFVVRGINFAVEAGKMVCVTGPSGSGKTTLLGGLCGLFPASEGSVQIGGIALTGANRSAVREHVSIVLQYDDLLEGAIEENIAFQKDPIDRDWVMECARLAVVHDDIMRAPKGYKTILGERGNGLSGGQRQRVLIARALYQKPKLLFLDEATSNLDVATERLLLENLRQSGITVVMTAHRPDAIAMCDKVFDLSKNKWLDGSASKALIEPLHSSG
jgi:ATP-binding cassette, subfamily B, bacterial CvaB/MchF/RaxB